MEAQPEFHRSQLGLVSMPLEQNWPYAVVVGSCVVYLVVFYFISPWLSRRYAPWYTKMFTRQQQIDWDTRTGSNLNAVVVTGLSIYILCTEGDSLARDPCWHDSNLGRIACALLIGYTVADQLVMFHRWKEIGEVLFIFHHLAGIIGFTFTITYGILEYFAIIRLLAEFSTPFVNMRWMLDAIKYPRSSKLFIGNGLTMTVTFFLCRIGIMPFYYYYVYMAYDTPGWNRLGTTLTVSCVLFCFLLDSLNIMWFCKMMRGVFKVLGISGGSAESQGKTNGVPKEKLEAAANRGENWACRLRNRSKDVDNQKRR